MHTALRLLAALGAVMAPAVTAQVVVVQSAYAQTAPALPPPPYAAANAAAPNTPARYGGMQAYDRYGGETRHAQPVFASPAGPPPMRNGPTLAWSGKIEAPASSPQSTPYAAAQARAAYTPAAYAPAQVNGAPRGWTFVQPIGAAAPAALPNSIYDAPPPAAPAQHPPGQTFAEAQAAAQAPAQAQAGAPRQAQAGPVSPDSQTGSGPRHYSVHRDYGIEPDPIPLPPQFFGATADLGQPATADPIRKTTTGNGKSQNPLQPEGGQ